MNFFHFFFIVQTPTKPIFIKKSFHSLGVIQKKRQDLSEV